MPYTSQQLDAIHDNSPKLLVSAAAGAGKTFVLVQRIMRMLIEDKLSLKRILVLTFTNAAASELKERISKHLFEKCLEDPSLQIELDNVANAHIETMHSFCGSLVRKQFQIVNVDPKVRTCSNSLRQKIIETSLNNTLDYCYENPSFQISSLVDCYTDVEIVAFIKELYSTIISFPNPFDWLSKHLGLNKNFESEDSIQAKEIYNDIKNAYIKSIYKYIQQSYELAQQTLEICMESECPSKYLDMANNDLLLIQSIYNKANNEDESVVADIDKIKFSNMPSIKDNPYKEIVKSARDNLKQCIAQISQSANLIKNYDSDTELMHINLQGLAQITFNFHNEFMRIKRRLNVIDFNDMEHMALEILKTKDIAENIKKSFDAIFIDECQDNSAIQETLLNALKSETNKIFMVGDVKQSIYRFRQAEPSLFISKMESYSHSEGASERKILLNKNFRSNPLVIDAVNRVFNFLMRKSITELDYKKGEDWLEAGREDDKGTQTKLVVLENNAEDTHNIELQASYVANQIKALIGTPMPNSDKKIRYRDIAILCSQLKDVDNVVKEVFEKHNIPLYADFVTQQNENIETNQIIAWIKLLYQPYDDLALLAILRGPIFRISDDNLSKIRLANSQSDLGFIDSFFSCADTADSLSDISENTEFKLNDIAEYEITSDKVFSIINNNIVYNSINKTTKTTYPQKLIKLDVPWQASTINNKLLSFEKIALAQNKAVDIPLKAKEANLDSKEYALYKICADIRRLISQERFICQNMKLEKYVWSFAIRSKLYFKVALMDDGAQKQSNIRSLCIRAKNFVDETNGNPEEFIEDCDSVQKSGDNLSPILLSPYDDLVRLMTIHKSKGLEFPIVFVIGLEKSILSNMEKRSELVLHSKLGLALNYRNAKLKTRHESLVNNYIKGFILNESLSERVRLLYVAMTRAKETLYLIGSSKPRGLNENVWNIPVPEDAIIKAKNFLDWLCQSIYYDTDSVALREIPADYTAEVFDTQLINSPIENISGNGNFKHWQVKYINCDSAIDDLSQLSRVQTTSENITLERVLNKIKNSVNDYKVPKVIQSITNSDDGVLNMGIKVVPQKTNVSTVVKLLNEKNSLNYINVLSDTAVSLPQPHKLPYYKPKSIKYMQSVPNFMLEPKRPSAAEIGIFTHMLLQEIDLQTIRNIIGVNGSDMGIDEKLSEAGKKPQNFSNIDEINKALSQANTHFINNIDNDIVNKLIIHIDNTLQNIVDRESLSTEEAKTININNIVSFFISPIAVRMLNSHVVLREHTFTLLLKGWKTPIMQGVIDLCFIENQHWVLLDYKTDSSKTNEGLKESYIPQMSMYKLALETLTNFTVKDCYIYSLHNREALRI